MPFLSFYIQQVTQDSSMILSHHWRRPADEPAMLNRGRNNFRPVNAVRGTDSTGMQLFDAGTIH